MSNTSLLNETHNPALTSWLVTANQANTDFPIQNLPFAVFKRANNEESFRGGVAIGDQVIDLTALANANVLDGLAQDAVKACSAPQLNDYMAMGKATWSCVVPCNGVQPHHECKIRKWCANLQRACALCP